MPRADDTKIDGLEALLAEAYARMPAQRAEVEEHIRRIREAVHDSRAVLDAGRRLEEIKKRKRYRALGYHSLGAMVVAEIGISRTTAHRWRAIARAAEGTPEIAGLGVRAAYDAVRPGTKEKWPPIERSHRNARDRVRHLARRRGMDGPRTTLERRDGRLELVLAIDIADAPLLASALSSLPLRRR